MIFFQCHCQRKVNFAKEAERDFYAACGKGRTYGPWSSNPLNDARQCTLPFAQPATKAEFGAKWAGVARVRNGERMEMLLR